MTLLQAHQWAILCEALHCGEVGENEFIEVSMDMKVSAERINAVLNELRAIDGVLS